MEMSHKCVNSAHYFCYIYGKITFALRKHALSPVVKRSYFLYFGCKVGDQDKSWALHVCCTSCSSKLIAWMNSKGYSMPFSVPMIWREPINLFTDCYFCMVAPIIMEIPRRQNEQCGTQIYHWLFFQCLTAYSKMLPTVFP